MLQESNYKNMVRQELMVHPVSLRRQRILDEISACRAFSIPNTLDYDADYHQMLLWLVELLEEYPAAPPTTMPGRS